LNINDVKMCNGMLYQVLLKFLLHVLASSGLSNSWNFSNPMTPYFYIRYNVCTRFVLMCEFAVYLIMNTKHQVRNSSRIKGKVNLN